MISGSGGCGLLPEKLELKLAETGLAMTLLAGRLSACTIRTQRDRENKTNDSFLMARIVATLTEQII